MKNFQAESFTYKAIIDASPDPVFLCISEQMTLSYANEAILKTCGKISEVMCKSFLEALPELKISPLINCY
ncbi:PAS domain-containing protein [Pedobacter sp. UYP1]|uniref:PAS domain-containing protein n=1 Tax=Pedobacter sp. UYP1 TaxID=1756396 RepID=UPI00339367FA